MKFNVSGAPVPSHSAIRASGPIEVQQDCVIKARVRKGNKDWGPLLQRQLTVTNGCGTISVTADIERDADRPLYNILGQPVQDPTPGIYIKNDKLTIIR